MGTVSYFCAYNFVPCTLIIFLAPAFTVSRTRQTFEAFAELVLSEDIPTLLLANHMPELEDGFFLKPWLYLMLWKADRLVCCLKASNFGGAFSTVVPPLANRIHFPRLTWHMLIVELYRHTTNCSSAGKSDSDICEGELAVDGRQFCKNRRYLWKFFPGFIELLFTFSAKWRWGIATAKSIKK